MDKWLHPLTHMGEFYYAVQNFNGATVEVWEWISQMILPFSECDSLLYQNDYDSLL